MLSFNVGCNIATIFSMSEQSNFSSSYFDSQYCALFIRMYFYVTKRVISASKALMFCCTGILVNNIFDVT